MAGPAVADLAGRVLAGRYRILGAVGAGASGLVYVADDVRLNRRVAVKALHGALADDAGFLRRFRSEAQHAAGLNHPNIVAVYDWGEDDGLPFMVLELLRGGSLRSFIDAGGRLSGAQAARVGHQVAQALHYAHSRGVVHRDVKSSNLLFDEHGNVRVADFGLARALAEASWTEPDGGVMGTARYAAPEQARGDRIDGRADCYSLAVVLIESLTGQVPNVGETAVSTVVARGSRPLEVPPGLGRLGQVLEIAGRPDPDRRFPDAGTMAEALAIAARDFPPPAPLVLPGLRALAADPDPTRIAPVVAPTTAAPDAAGALGPGGVPGPIDDDGPPLVVAPRRRRSRPPGSHRLVPVVVAVVLLAALVVGGVTIASAVGTLGAGSVTVPGLVGVTEKDANAAVAAAGLRVEVVRRSTDDVAGLVIDQDPPAGDFVRDGATVRMTVSSGPPPVPVPVTTGATLADAQARLTAAGFEVVVQRAFDETVAKDVVLGSTPAGDTRAPRDSKVVLKVSDGPAPVPVDDVAGRTFDEASAVLRAKGFQVARADVFSDSVESGKVVGTDPAAGQPAARGGTVTVNVSKGPELVAVPTVVGVSVEVASQRLQAAGLVPDVQNYAPGRTVRASDPVAGAQVRKGSKVTLFL